MAETLTAAEIEDLTKGIVNRHSETMHAVVRAAQAFNGKKRTILEISTAHPVSSCHGKEAILSTQVSDSSEEALVTYTNKQGKRIKDVSLPLRYLKPAKAMASRRTKTKDGKERRTKGQVLIFRGIHAGKICTVESGPQEGKVKLVPCEDSHHSDSAPAAKKSKRSPTTKIVVADIDVTRIEDM